MYIYVDLLAAHDFSQKKKKKKKKKEEEVCIYLVAQILQKNLLHYWNYYDITGGLQHLLTIKTVLILILIYHELRNLIEACGEWQGGQMKEAL